MGQLPRDQYTVCERIAQQKPISVLDILCGDGERLNFIRGRYSDAVLYGLETDMKKIEKLQQMAIPFAIEGIDKIDSYRNFEYALCHGDISPTDLQRISKVAKYVYWFVPDGYEDTDAYYTEDGSIFKKTDIDGVYLFTF